ncbi:MAG: disulfide oxidoreductase, partial [Pseudomonadota bacterium]
AQALRPEFHLRADRFYNAPDTEMDFTEQGGLMWGDQAVGKMVKGAEPLKPGVEAFVDEEAGPEVMQKVQRRLQHFVDRKVAAAMEPLLAMSRDEAVTGLARGFAFRLMEGFGILPRQTVAREVKELDQDARGQLRKHGVRFGQHTIFQQLLLKPAPTRLRLLLWGLHQGLSEFPEAPPPGLVTVPKVEGAPEGYYTMAGYRLAGSRAIRIDMLERLADLLRPADSRAGFEATPDMLSISGTTLEQFADLMQGLGYKAEKGERPKVKPAPTADEPEQALSAPPDSPGGTEPVPSEAMAETVTPTGADETAEAPAEVEGTTEASADMVEPVEASTEATETVEAPAEAKPVAEPATPESEPQADASEAPDTASAEAAPQAEEAETEVFYTFTWAPRRQPHRGPRRDGQGDRPKAKGKPKGKGPKGPRKESGPRTFQAKPTREKAVDPDNPFAALAALKDK